MPKRPQVMTEEKLIAAAEHLRIAWRASAWLAFVLLFASGAQAQVTRTWVSGTGDDGNECSRTKPCKTLAGAISKTAMGGEITVLDAGGFSTVTIAKSITIDGTAAAASILAPDFTAITINMPFTVGRPSKDPRIVRLRGLSINGAGTGNNGINIISANKVTVEDCVIDGFKHNGINVQNATLFVRNTTIRNNDGAGINVTGSSQVALTDSSLVFNGTGLIGNVVKYFGVVLFGNRNGDPPPP